MKRPDMSEKRIKVIYIAGATRSGSTILSGVLGEVDGAFNAGELIDIWDRGVQSNGKCSCGMPFNSCELWNDVIGRTFNGDLDIERLIQSRDRFAHSVYVPVKALLNGKDFHSSSDAFFLKTLEKLYKGIHYATQCDVIIDSSKNVGYGFLLNKIPTIDLYVVHLIRDSRATAYSWIQKKEGLHNIGPVQTSMVWNIRNIALSFLCRQLKPKYLRIHYEEFVRNPSKAVGRICRLGGLTPKDLPFLTPNSVQLGLSHSVYGNPDRFKKGVVKLKMDQRWRAMNVRDQILVTALTLPLLVKYGYPVLPKFHPLNG